MKIVARCIYYKAVTPSCDIVEMDQETWREFLYAKNERRIEMVLKLTGHEYMEGKVRELVWIPLDENMELKITKSSSKQEGPGKQHNPTREEIEQYRQAVIEELRHLDVEPFVNIEQEIQEFLVCPDSNMITYMQYNTPLECAEMLVM